MHSIQHNQMQPSQLQEQQLQHNQQDSQQEPNNRMAVLQMLDPAQQLDQQQLMGRLDPQAQQANQQQQQQLVQHLVQPNAPRPLLHQLQPSSHSSQQSALEANGLAANQQQSDELVNQQQQQQQQLQQQHHQSQQQQQQAANGNLLRPRTQIEGIVADGGGPIVQWLMDNYEVSDGESLPRSTVYNHYLAHCRHLQMASVNAASFGKLIRSVFVGLKTRRLGTRGHSKYHYFGVRAKQHVQQELMMHQQQQDSNAGCSRENHHHQNNENSNQNTDNGSESDSTGNGLECGRLSSSSSGKRIKRVSSNSHQAARRASQHHLYIQQQQELDQQKEQHIELAPNGLYYTTSNGFLTSNDTSKGIMNSGQNSDHHLLALDHCELTDFRNHLGANWATLVDEHWPHREACALEHQLIKETGGASDMANSLQLFEANYRSYYKRMVELLSELKFFDVERLWRDFWHPVLDDQAVVAPETHQWQMDSSEASAVQNSQADVNHLHVESYQQQQQPVATLSFQTLYQLTEQPLVIDWINQIDYNLYAAIESFLLPDMLSPIPRLLAQQIRMFAKNIGLWIEQSVKDYSVQFAAEKSKSARAFGHALRRYTSLNHLSTASRAIWEKRSSLAQMSEDLNRVDLRDIEHQVSLMSHGNGTGSDGSGASGANLLSAAAVASVAPVELQSANVVVANNSSSVNNNNNNNNQTELAVNELQQSSNIKGSAINEIDQHHQHHNHQQRHPHHLCAMQPAQLIQNFLHLLEDPYPANSWPDWCRNLVESRVCGLSVEEARNFVLKWNFYISLIMKELTLKSAPSFGSFQLIRLLFDEYIFYLVVTRLAQAQHKTPAQLLSL